MARLFPWPASCCASCARLSPRVLQPHPFRALIDSRPMQIATKPAVILLSGGLDSTTTLAIAKSEGFSPYAITFRYGQRHQAEIEAATNIAKANQVAQHIIADIDLRIFGGSALTSDIEV